MRAYRPRIIDAELRRQVYSAGAVVVEGARATGKTESARQLAASELLLDGNSALAQLARVEPSAALPGETPRLLDEFRVVPGLWNEVRRAVDDRGKSAQFILTGSASPSDDPLRHSGAGRFTHVFMRTMSLTETGHSAAAISLAGLFDDATVPLAESDIGFRDVTQRLVTGGWPGWQGVSPEAAAARATAYIADIAQRDYPQVAGPRRDPRRLTAYLRAVAGLTAQPATYAAITRRMSDESGINAGPAAVPELHDLAIRMFLVEDQPSWSPRLRSATALVQTPKRHLVDPSLAASLLGASAHRLLSEPETLGFLFEAQAVHDLRVYAQASGARGVFHYRDSKGRDEIDAVVEGSDGRWVGFEVKLGLGAVDEAAANLLRVSAKIARPPAALVVIVPTGVAHRRPDGILVVPLTVLGP